MIQILYESDKGKDTSNRRQRKERDNKKTIDFQNYAFVREELNPYMAKFDVLRILPLNKTHPA